jgi:hypothetical protein
MHSTDRDNIAPYRNFAGQVLLYGRFHEVSILAKYLGILQLVLFGFLKLICDNIRSCSKRAAQTVRRVVDEHTAVVLIKRR